MKQKLLVLLIAALLVVLMCTACTKTETVVICGHCSAKVSENSQYCSNCGGLLFQSNNNPSDTTTIPATDPSDTTTAQATEPSATNPQITEPPATEPPATEPPATTHTHSWSDATCTAPKTCSTCKATEGNAKGHSWDAATCTAPKTCKTCGATDGSALGHAWSEATCTSAKTCSRCQKTEGSALGHSHTATKTPATCTTQGYTTYTCKCGDSYIADYVAPAHTYQKYVCTSCGQVDKAHAYEYLMQWILANGKLDGTSSISISDWSEDVQTRLGYSTNDNYIFLSRSFYYEDEFFFFSLSLDSYFYGCQFCGCDIYGYLNASSFTSSSTITYVQYNGNETLKNDMIEIACGASSEVLNWLSLYLATNNVGITIADLGFTAY